VFLGSHNFDKPESTDLLERNNGRSEGCPGLRERLLLQQDENVMSRRKEDLCSGCDILVLCSRSRAESSVCFLVLRKHESMMEISTELFIQTNSVVSIGETVVLIGKLDAFIADLVV
jgi:hypothetical protein